MTKALTKERNFSQVDVFTAVPMMGNPVAVVLDGEGLSDAEMQAFANWTNLSETTFVTPSADADADYDIRIFTPRAELPFAGHPTLGTAHALIEAGRITPTDGVVRQRSAIGIVPVRIDGEQRSFRLPDASHAPAPDVDTLAKALPGCTLTGAPAIVTVGPHWVIAEIADSASVEALNPDLALLADYDRTHRTTGLTLFSATGPDTLIVRTFAPADGIAEDPVCGSGNGAVAAYRLGAGQVGPGQSYTVAQGKQAGRDGKVAITIDDSGGIHVGGNCVTLVRGTVTL